MTQGNYKVLLDFNQDGYWGDGVSTGDPLNILRNVANKNIIEVASPTLVSFNRTFSEIDYTYFYRCETGTGVNAGFIIGATYKDRLEGISIESASQITVSFECRYVSGTAGQDLSWQVFSVPGLGGTVNSSITTLTLSSSWVQTSVTFTPDIEWIYIYIYRSSGTSDVAFQVRNIMIVDGSTAPTVYNTGDGLDAYNDITNYVTSAQWNIGMDNDLQDIAGGGRCTLTLQDPDGHFLQETIGADVVTNGDFTNWTAGLPDDWAHTYGGVQSMITEADFDEVAIGSTFGSLVFPTGSGSLNIVSGSTSTTVTLSQDCLTAGTPYLLAFDIGGSSENSTWQPNNLVFINGNRLIGRPFKSPGHYEFTFIANDATLTIATINAANLTIDNVSVKPVSRYYGLALDTRVSIRAVDGGTTRVLYNGKLRRVQFQRGAYLVPTVTLEFDDGLSELSNIEYRRPSVPGNSYPIVSELEFMVLGGFPFAVPYRRSWWNLGASILGEDTWLFESDIDTSGLLLTQVYASQASNPTKGVSAAGFLRDLMAAEMGGRLYINPQTGVLTVVSRKVDHTLNTPTYTVTSDEIDSAEMVYAEDLINQVTVMFKSQQESNSNVVLWSSPEDITVDKESTKRITARYRDPNDTTTPISATSIEPMARGLDYILSDTTNQKLVTVAVESNFNSATITIRNDRKVDVTLTTLQLRGVPVYSVADQSITVSDAVSIYTHGLREVSFNLPVLADTDEVSIVAGGKLNEYAVAITRAKSITFSATKSSDRYTRAAQPRLNNLITLNLSDDYDHSRNYIIIGERHQLVPGGEHTHTVTWILKCIDRIGYWFLGVAGRSELGTTTYLAY